jgi:signal transduction histidine kinase
MQQELLSVSLAMIATVAQWLIFLYLHRDNRVSFLWWWNLGWLCYALWWGWLMLAVVTHESWLWQLLRAFSAGLAAFFSCASGLAFQRQFTLRAAHWVGLGLYTGFVVFSTAFLPGWGPGLVSLAIGGGYVVSGLLFFSAPPGQPTKGATLLASALLLRGVLWASSPFFFHSPTWGQGFMAVGALIHQLVVIGMIILVLEYSKQRALELTSRLEQAERLATLGELSAGVAHEIRNPLGAIVNAVFALDAASMDFSPEEKRTLLTVVKQEATRLNRLLTDFVQFAKPLEPQRTLGDINVLLGEIAALLRRDASTAAGITIREELAPDLPKTLFDADQLRQAIWNIAKNGVESMVAGQELRMTSQVCRDAVLIRIQDTGSGIAADEVQKIFRPFHSRKAGGTGLGLAIAARIIQAHTGQITVESQRGAGTTFVIHLPVTEGVLHHGVHSRR